tara:strand:+ start:14407 stop:17247 length:2841 start_codon:yes stop_codon:yes gene_type:complete
MEQKEFLEKVLPSSELGEYCLASIDKSGQVAHKFSKDLSELLVWANKQNINGSNSYFSQSVFKDGRRTAENSTHLKSLFLDIDCDGREYTSNKEAIQDLIRFSQELNLDQPTIIQSGGGFHCYWATDTNIPKEDWLEVAKKFKTLCKHHNFKIDLAVPSDPTRLLRLPFTRNFKRKRLCDIEAIGEVVSWEQLREKVFTAYQRDISKEKTALAHSSIDKPFDSDNYNFEYSWRRIAEKTMQGKGCGQLKWIVTEQKKIGERVWFAGLSIANLCVEENAIHEMSRLHPEYDHEKTELKARRIQKPHTCATFEEISHDSNICLKCPNRGKVKTPLHLGRITKENTQVQNLSKDIIQEKKKVLKTIASETEHEYPDDLMPFSRGANGGVLYSPPPVFDKKSGQMVQEDPVEIYENDFYIVKRITDPIDGDSVIARVHFEHDGVKDFPIPMKCLGSSEKFGEVVRSSGVMPYKHLMERLMQYVTKWVKHLQSQQKADTSHANMGWTNDLEGFVLGYKEYRKDGGYDVAPNKAITEVAPTCRTGGQFEKWRECFEKLDAEGLEYQTFLAGASFGTPLLKYTNVNGAILNLYSRKPGSGKTLSGYFALSVWGCPSEMMLAKHTINAKFERLGVLRSLPLYVDEISNMTPQDLSDFAYTMPMGKGKARMMRSSNQERKNNTKWATLALTTSNTSAYELLSRYKSSAEGEMVRILQLNIDKKPDWFTINWCRQNLNPIHENYGHAGIMYAQWLCCQTDKELKRRVELWMDRVINDTNKLDRHWVAIIASSMAGMEIASEIDIVGLNYERIYDAVIKGVRSISKEAYNKVKTSEQILGDFLALNANNSLVLRQNGKDDSGYDTKVPIATPKNKLVMRVEKDTKRTFVIKSEMEKYCSDVKYNFREFEKDLLAKGIIVKRRSRETIDKGWEQGSGYRPYCIIFDQNAFKEIEDERT